MVRDFSNDGERHFGDNPPVEMCLETQGLGKKSIRQVGSKWSLFRGKY